MNYTYIGYDCEEFTRGLDYTIHKDSNGSILIFNDNQEEMFIEESFLNKVFKQTNQE